jgi:hypothetical protein
MSWLDEGRGFPSNGYTGNDPVLPALPAPLERGTRGYRLLMPGVNAAQLVATETRLRIAEAALTRIAECSALSRQLGACEPYSERIANHALALLGTKPR